MVLGQKFAGTVTEVGSNVDGVAVGDKVAVEPLLYSGKCSSCKKGNYYLCELFNTASLGVNDDGGFAAYLVADAYHMHKLPESMTLE